MVINFEQYSVFQFQFSLDTNVIITSRCTTQFSGPLTKPNSIVLSWNPHPKFNIPERGTRSNVYVATWKFIPYLYWNVETDLIFMSERENRSQLVCQIVTLAHSTNQNHNVYSHNNTTRGYSWHTIIKLSSFTIRVLHNATFVYIHAL